MKITYDQNNQQFVASELGAIIATDKSFDAIAEKVEVILATPKPTPEINLDDLDFDFDDFELL